MKHQRCCPRASRACDIRHLCFLLWLGAERQVPGRRNGIPCCAIGRLTPKAAHRPGPGAQQALVWIFITGKTWLALCCEDAPGRPSYPPAPQVHRGPERESLRPKASPPSLCPRTGAGSQQAFTAPNTSWGSGRPHGLLEALWVAQGAQRSDHPGPSPQPSSRACTRPGSLVLVPQLL